MDSTLEMCEVVLAYLRSGPAWAADMPERKIKVLMSDGILLVAVDC